MIRVLLSTVMVATQLLSWNASPRYLCHSEDGSICVDLGPATCDCCRHEAAQTPPADDHQGCAHHEGCAHHDGGNVPRAASLVPCGCTHVQLSETQNATRARAAAAPDAHRLVLPLAFAAQGVHSCLAARGDAAPPWHPPDQCAENLAHLASVVLRC
jgi:hypothetical protein